MQGTPGRVFPGVGLSVLGRHGVVNLQTEVGSETGSGFTSRWVARRRTSVWAGVVQLLPGVLFTGRQPPSSSKTLQSSHADTLFAQV